MTMKPAAVKTNQEHPYHKSLQREILEWVIYLTGSIVIALIIVHFLGRFSVVEGSSMQPTLQNKDILIVENLSFRWLGIQSGDIVVVKIPEVLGGNRKYAIKRIIAKEGQSVQIKNGQVTVNGATLEEKYISGLDTSDMDSPYMEVKVPEGCVYLLGDNRNPGKSLDSRVFGVIKEDRIIGKAWLRLFPFSEIGFVEKK